MRVSKTGQDAITHFKVEKEYKGSYSLVRFRLETGRTHQIRVHMAYYNHPLLGDELYGERVQKCLEWLYILQKLHFSIRF